MKTKYTANMFALTALTTSILTTALSSSVLAQTDSVVPPLRPPPGLTLPGFGPGVAGNVSEGPINPVCRPDIPCTRPFANARVLILDSANREPVASTESNALGNFIVSVAPGNYLVHIEVVDFPRCPEAKVTVGNKNFSLVQIECDTGIR